MYTLKQAYKNHIRKQFKKFLRNQAKQELIAYARYKMRVTNGYSSICPMYVGLLATGSRQFKSQIPSGVPDTDFVAQKVMKIMEKMTYAQKTKVNIAAFYYGGYLKNHFKSKDIRFVAKDGLGIFEKVI